MARTTNDQGGVGFSVKILPEDREFLGELTKIRSRASIAEVIRELFTSQRTLYGLPSFMADRIRKDMKDRKIDIVDYVRDLLGHRYEELAKNAPETKAKR